MEDENTGPKPPIHTHQSPPGVAAAGEGESARRARALLETSERLARIGGWEWDPSGGAAFWTPNLYRLHDMDPADFPPGSPDHTTRSLECYDTADRPTVLAAFQRCAREGVAYDLTLPFTSRRGRRLWVRITGEAAMEGGRVLKVVGVLRDVTRTHRAEEALRESENRFRRIFDQAPVGAALVSLDLRFVRVNQAFCQMLRSDESELVGTSFPAITHPDHAEHDKLQARRLVSGEIDVYETDKRYIRKDGSIVWAQVSVRLIKDEARRPAYFLPVVTDITARKNAEDERVRREVDRLLREAGLRP